MRESHLQGAHVLGQRTVPCARVGTLGFVIDVRRAGERLHTKLDWLDSWHSFSFGHHYDAANTHHGLLLVHNDDVVSPGGGFGTHAHRDMEIVTWVLDGALEHRDSAGNQGVITPGVAQRMSAGTGIRHSEQNASSTEPVHFLQMWVPPDRSVDPGYEQADVTDRIAGDGLVPLASGREPGAAVQLHQRGATLWVARLGPGTTVAVPDAPYVHVFVARGTAELGEAGVLSAGDAARLTGSGEMALAAGPAGAEITVWETHATLA